nr:MAG TPA: hypothetical protein [Caudoviricetes sp.]
MKPSHVGYFCIIPTLWLKKQVITGYFASIIIKQQKAYTYKSLNIQCGKLQFITLILTHHTIFMNFQFNHFHYTHDLMTS